MVNIIKRTTIIAVIGILMITAMYGCNKKDEEKEEVMYPYSTGDVFISNIKDDKKLLQCDIVIESNDKKHIEKLFVDKNYVIRDKIYSILRDQTLEQLQSPDAQKNIAETIVPALNEALGIESIKNIYFNSFAIN